MAINFEKFNKQQLAVVCQLGNEIDATPDVHDIIEFRGGFIPKVVYVAAVRNNRVDSIGIIQPTRTGAVLARNVTLIASLSAKQMELEGDREGVVAMQMAASLAVRFACEETVHDSYHEWFLACEHVPSDLTETQLSLLFAGEVLDQMLHQLQGGLSELMDAARGVKRATLH